MTPLTEKELDALRRFFDEYYKDDRSNDPLIAELGDFDYSFSNAIFKLGVKGAISEEGEVN